MHNTVRVVVCGGLRALGGWGGVQHHGVVVRGWRAARVLPQLRVVVHRPDVATAGEAEAGPGDVGKPRLLALAGYSQAKEKEKWTSGVNQPSRRRFVAACPSQALFLCNVHLAFLILERWHWVERACWWLGVRCLMRWYRPQHSNWKTRFGSGPLLFGGLDSFCDQPLPALPKYYVKSWEPVSHLTV